MVKVVKFGGSSLASADQFKKVGNIIRAEESRRYVVPSAPGKRFSEDTKVTDMLYKCYAEAEAGKNFDKQLKAIEERYNEIIKGLGLKLSLKEQFETIKKNFESKAGKDYAASRGEYLNGIIMANYLGYEFIDAASVICFDPEGEFDGEKTNKVMADRLANVEKAVIPGFYGAMPNGEVKTFSRGGSDVTGSIVATDPRIVDNPRSIEVITYKELRELSYMGATVLHESAIFPVRKEGIPINIRNTNAPQDKGTMIVETTCNKPDCIITGIAGKKGFVSITIDKDMMNSEIGFGRKVLQVFEDNGISFEHMPSGIDTMTVFVHQDEFVEKEQKVLAQLHRAVNPDSIELESDLSLIAVVGRGMRNNSGLAANIFSALAKAKINIKMIDQGSSELNIIIGVRNRYFEDAIKTIYDVFVPNNK